MEKSVLKKSQRATKVFVGLLSVVAPLVVVAPVAAADAPTQELDTITFVDVNPCTGLDHTVTFAVSVSEHSHGERVVANAKRTITTDPDRLCRSRYELVRGQRTDRQVHTNGYPDESSRGPH